MPSLSSNTDAEFTDRVDAFVKARNLYFATMIDQNDDEANALKGYLQSVETSPDFTLAYVQIVSMAIGKAQKEPETARQWLEKLIAIRPEIPCARDVLYRLPSPCIMRIPVLIYGITLSLSIFTANGRLWASELDDLENPEQSIESSAQALEETTENIDSETAKDALADTVDVEVELEKMIIEAIAPTADSTSELSDIDLRLKSASTLGKTLERELGVYNASFGPGVGQPIIRGMGGPRVRVMHDGIGSHDASAMSQDNAVAAESLLSDSIYKKGPYRVSR